MQVRVIKSIEDLKAVMAELQGVPAELPKVSPETPGKSPETVTLSSLLERMQAAIDGIPTEEKPEEKPEEIAVSTEEIIQSVNHKLPPMPEELWQDICSIVKRGDKKQMQHLVEYAREAMKEDILAALKKQ